MADDGEWTEVVSKKKAQKQKKMTMYAPHIQEEYQESERDSYKRTALDFAKRQAASLVKEVSGTQTVCLMFYRNASRLMYLKDYSGTAEGATTNFRVVREISGVKADKKSYCAEEHLIVGNKGTYNFMFSIAFDINGVKQACGGCRKLLETYGIKDLYSSYA